MTRDELRAKVLATTSPKPAPLNVPEWGDVYIKPLLVGEVEDYADGSDPKLRTAQGIARVLCSADGELLFDVNSPEDLFAINRLPASSLQKINEGVNRANAVSTDAQEDLGNGSPPATDSSSI